MGFYGLGYEGTVMGTARVLRRLEALEGQLFCLSRSWVEYDLYDARATVINVTAIRILHAPYMYVKYIFLT